LFPPLRSFLIACYCVALFFFENSNLPSFCLKWETARTTPSRMVICARGACTVTASLYCCGMPLCRLATGIEPQSTTVGSMRSTVCSIVRSTSISRPTLCFLTGAHGPRELLGPTWMMLWRRLLTWHCVHLTTSVAKGQRHVCVASTRGRHNSRSLRRLRPRMHALLTGRGRALAAKAEPSCPSHPPSALAAIKGTFSVHFVRATGSLSVGKSLVAPRSIDPWTESTDFFRPKQFQKKSNFLIFLGKFA
jgi:hypothetical protein